MNTWHQRLQGLAKLGDINDVFVLIGCALVWYGFDQLLPGLGPALVGLYLLAGVAITQLKAK